MSKWKNSLQEEPSGEHEQAVLKAMRLLLKQNVELAAPSRAMGWWLVFPALALGAVAVVLLPHALQKSDLSPPAAAEKLELAFDFDMYRDLREIESMELLQKLGDPDKWPTRKAKTRKI